MHLYCGGLGFLPQMSRNRRERLPPGHGYPVRARDVVASLAGLADEASIGVTFWSKQSLDQSERNALARAKQYRLIELQYFDASTDAARRGAAREDREPRPSVSANAYAVPAQLLAEHGLRRNDLVAILREHLVPVVTSAHGCHRFRVRIHLDARAAVLRCRIEGTEARHNPGGSYRELRSVAIECPARDVSGHAR